MAIAVSRNLFAALGHSSGNLSRSFLRVEPVIKMAEPRWNSDMPAFRGEFARAKHIVVLTGAGVSAESGVPTFRGAGGYWRTFQAQDVATPTAFARNPSQVWEFYHYRRELMLTKQPNRAHIALAECEQRLAKQNRKITVITQNIDQLHQRAGSENVIELHGTLFKTRCVKCSTVREDRNSPIVPALQGRGQPTPVADDSIIPEKDLPRQPTPVADDSIIPEKDLPRCQERGCGSLVRPHVIWFGESLDDEVLRKTHSNLKSCDLCLVVGTSSVVYPAAMFAPALAARGVTVAEFNTEATPATDQLTYHFHGPAGEYVPAALARHPSEPE